MLKKITRFLVSLLLMITTDFTIASDLEREKRLANQNLDAIIEGDPVFLNADQHSFLTIYTETEASSKKGGVIIMHGRGLHPNTDNVVAPLRTGLINYGWDTLSIQMPVLHKTAKYYDYIPIFPESYPRINAAIQYLKHKNLKQIILIAHSCSVHMTMNWIKNTSVSHFDGYIGISMGATDYQQPMQQPFPFHLIKAPLLDIYGSEDYDGVIRTAKQRLKAIRQNGHYQSEQKVILGANHYFEAKNEALVNTIKNWLDLVANPAYP